MTKKKLAIINLKPAKGKNIAIKSDILLDIQLENMCCADKMHHIYKYISLLPTSTFDPEILIFMKVLL